MKKYYVFTNANMFLQKIKKLFFTRFSLFKKIDRIRFYVYLLSSFIVLFLLLFLFILHQNRYFINTDIHYYYPTFQDRRTTLNNDNNSLLYLDFKTDSSITKFVNNKIGFEDKNYFPSDLVKISSDYVFDSKGNSLLRKEANDALQKMAKDFYDFFKTKMIVVSGFRSYEYQLGIIDNGCSNLFCAVPGFSEHQSGLAMDLWEASSVKDFLGNKKLASYFSWMKDNAYKYGFTNTYQKGVDIDGYVVEPWHWRYVGIDFAKELYEKGMTIAEYYKKYIEKQEK